jgi:hypothetical protein
MTGIEIALGFALMEVGIGGAAAGWIATAMGSVVIPVAGSMALSYAAYLLQPNAQSPTNKGFDRSRISEAVSRCAIWGTVAVEGDRIHDNVYGSDKRQLQIGFALADHECVELQKVIADGKERSLSSGSDGFDYHVGGYSGRFKIHFKNGAYNQTHFNPFVTHATGDGNRWTVDHDLRNVAYVACKFEYRQKEFPTRQPPQCRFVVKGGKWYDPRKDSTVSGGSGAHRWDDKSTWEYSANPYVCLYNYLRGYFVNGELWFGAGLPADELDIESFMTAATACDVVVTNPDGSTRARYEIHTVVRGGRDTDHRSVMDQVMMATNGLWTIRAGKVWVAAGYNRTPVATITDTDIMEGEPRRDSDKRSSSQGLVNEVHATYTSASREYKPKEIQPYRVDADQIADGRRLETAMDLTMVTNRWQAQQIVYQTYRASRLQWNFEVTLTPEWLCLEPGDVITWQSDEYGWTKRFLITTWEYIDADTVKVRVGLQETAASIWDAASRNYSESEIAEPNDDLTTTAPAGLTATQVKIEGNSGKKKAAAEVTWTPPDDNSIDAIVIEIRRQGTTRVFKEREDDVEGGTATLIKGFGVDGTYEVRASYIRQEYPTERSWTSWVEVTSDGDDTGDGTEDTIPPAAPTALTLVSKRQTERKSGKTLIEIEATWTPPTDSDLKDYDFQYRRAGGSGRWQSRTTDDSNFEFEAREDVTYECRVRAQDKSGNRSAFTAIATITTTTDTAPPGSCSGLVVTGVHKRNKLRWTNPVDADYRVTEIWAAKDNNRTIAQRVGKVATDTFTHDDLKNAESWYYWVRAVDESGNEGPFFPLNGNGGINSTTGRLGDDDMSSDAPNAPGSAPTLSHANRTAGDGSVKSKLIVTWTASTSTDVKHYELGVQEGNEAEEIYKVNGTRASYRASSGETYNVRVRSVGFNENKSAWTAISSYTVGGKTGTPEPPSSLSVTQKPNGLVLRWRDSPTNDVKVYDVFRRATNTAPDASSVPLDTIKGTRFVDDDATRGNTFYYWVRSVDNSGNKSTWAGPVSSTARGLKAVDLDATLPLAPGAPTLSQWQDKQADGTRVTRFRATWAAPAGGAPGYKVGVTMTGGPEVIYPVGTLFFETIGVIGKTYTVRIFTLDRLGNTSTPSASASITLTADTTAPPVPTNVRTRQKKGGIVVTWNEVNAPDLRHYEIYESSANTTPADTVAPTDRVLANRWVQDETPQGATRYYFVRSVDRVGNKSAWSTVSNSGTPAKLQGADLATGTITADQIQAGAVTKIWVYNLPDATASSTLWTATIPRTPGSNLLIEATWLCGEVPPPYTGTRGNNMRTPTEIRRNGSIIVSIENEVPTMIDASSFSSTTGEITVKAAGRQRIAYVDQANLSGNVTYLINRTWPTFTRQRQIIVTEFRR